MKKIKFLLPLFVLFIALFTSCSPDVGTPEEDPYTKKDPWPNLENFYGMTFDLMQDNEVSGGQFKAGTVEITNNGDVIIKDNNGNSLIPGFNSLKEMYDAATCRVETSSSETNFGIIFRTYPKAIYAIDTKEKIACIATTDTRNYNYTIVETPSSNN